jgi:hypothetical protein
MGRGGGGRGGEGEGAPDLLLLDRLEDLDDAPCVVDNVYALKHLAVLAPSHFAHHLIVLLVPGHEVCWFQAWGCVASGCSPLLPTSPRSGYAVSLRGACGRIGKG